MKIANTFMHKNGLWCTSIEDDKYPLDSVCAFGKTAEESMVNVQKLMSDVLKERLKTNVVLPVTNELKI